MFALLNKYSKILEIPKSHLCIPVLCMQSNFVNTIVSDLNRKETIIRVEIWVYKNQNCRETQYCVKCYKALPGRHWSQRTLTFAGFSVPRACVQPSRLVSLPISFTVQRPRSEIMAKDRKNQGQGKAGLQVHYSKFQFKYSGCSEEGALVFWCNYLLFGSRFPLQIR